MKYLNTKSTRIFLKLIKKLGAKEYLKIEEAGYMTLNLEGLHKVWTDAGEGKLYSLSHSYVQQGDLMRDPEMCFIVMTVANTNQTFIYPTMYRQDGLGIYEESVYINNGKVTTVIPTWQAAHCAFANMWLQNILAQGFLK